MNETIEPPVWPRQWECDDFYGNPRGEWGSHANPEWERENIVYIEPPYEMFMGSIHIRKIPIHKKCADSLLRVLTNLVPFQDLPGYREFDGSYVYRSMRGGSHLSMHAYGIAIDFDAAHNKFRSKRHRFQEGDPIVKAFDNEGWIWGSRWKHPDAMHWQAAKL